MPRRWENPEAGRAGYAPMCRNEWVRGVCGKPQVRCGECPNQAFTPLGDDIIRAHLAGNASGNAADFTVGVYPMLPDEARWFLVTEFDKILRVELANRYHQDSRHCNQGSMDLRTGAPATQGGTWDRPLRRPIVDGITSARLDDDDCLRLPPIPPHQGSGTKKASQDLRRNPPCRPSGEPSSTSSRGLHPCDARVVEGPSQRPPKKSAEGVFVSWTPRKTPVSDAFSASTV